LQISVAIKKILYAADAKESALEEAQAYINETLEEAVEDEPETET
jgi:RP/EB family microtubule-associated protein